MTNVSYATNGAQRSIIKCFKWTFSIGKYGIRVDRRLYVLFRNKQIQHVTALKCLNPWLADQSTEFLYCLYLMEYEGKYLEKYLNTCI